MNENNYEELCRLVKELYNELQEFPFTDIPENAWDIVYRMYDIANDKYPRLGS